VWPLRPRVSRPPLPDCAVRAGGGLRGPPALPPDRARALEDEMVHRPAPKVWWHRGHVICMCGLLLEECPDYRLQEVRKALAR
jgi:hypothetical protein